MYMKGRQHVTDQVQVQYSSTGISILYIYQVYNTSIPGPVIMYSIRELFYGTIYHTIPHTRPGQAMFSTPPCPDQAQTENTCTRYQ